MSYPKSTPSIRIQSSSSQAPSRWSPKSAAFPASAPSSAIPMAIPNARETAPPPLPPPRYISALERGQDAGWQWSNARSQSHSPNLASVKPGSSLLLGSGSRAEHHSVDPGDPHSSSRRSSQTSSHMAMDAELSGSGRWEGSEDESQSGSRPSLANFSRLHSERELGPRVMQNSSQAYDKSLLSRIGGPKSPHLNRPPMVNMLSRTGSDMSQSSQSGSGRNTASTKSLNALESRYPPLESPQSRWQHSAMSPRMGFRSPLHDRHTAETPASTRHNSTVEPLDPSQTHRGSVDHHMIFDPELMEENGMRELDINDRSPAASEDFSGSLKGVKRRASSPPSDGTRDDRLAGHGNDLYNRRTNQAMAYRSPVSRHLPPLGSMSSNGSLAMKGSYASTGSWNPSMASSMTSHGGDRASPGALSSLEEHDQRHGQLSPRSFVQTNSPKSRYVSAGGTQTGAQPELRSVKTAADNEARKGERSMGISGFLVCDCCPKKPKKFETREELLAHVGEKQYQCLYCPNRFKNKNEAERHQNSLHLRKHSWSCAALGGVHAAFHASATQPSTVAICGYCGQEFPNPADWEARAEHLCQVHKFGECNQSKKFFRADHFRQHLKHSHAGTSGKWTSMLETACQKEEAPPQPMSKSRGSQLAAATARHALQQLENAAPRTTSHSMATQTDPELEDLPPIHPALQNA